MVGVHAQVANVYICCSNNDGRPNESEEAASRSSAQSCSSSSPVQPVIDPAVRDALISPKYRIQGRNWCSWSIRKCRSCSLCPEAAVLHAVLRFEADVEKFVQEGGEKDLTFDANLTGYQVVY